MKAIRNGVELFFALTPIWALVFMVLILQNQVLYRTETLFGDKVVEVSVLSRERLAYSTSTMIGVELSQSEGKIFQRTGIPGGRGRPPLIITRPALTNEIALYREFFPMIEKQYLH